MSVVLAPDSFKGSITAASAARALAAGWATVRPGDAVVLLPMADGGEGTLDAFAAAVPAARRMPVTVAGPDGGPVAAHWLLLPGGPDAPTGIGLVELAGTSGIERLGGRRLPLDAGTFGLGQAIAAALDHGVARCVVGIGSSASTDGGTGMLTALGARFTDAAGRVIAPGARGLGDLAHVDLTELRPLPAGGVTVLSDVVNPLLGPDGAAAVFGPQKGMDAAAVARADAGLARLAEATAAAGAGVDPQTPGAGAAGGTGFALRAWGATLVPGAGEVATLLGLPAALRSAAVAITGEGAFDRQSAAGKAPDHVASLARAAGVPIALVAGRIAPDADTSAFATVVSLVDLAGSAAAAMADPQRWLHTAGALLAERLADGAEHREPRPPAL